MTASRRTRTAWSTHSRMLAFAVPNEKTKPATPLGSDDQEVTQAVSKITWTVDSIGEGRYQR